MNFLEKVYDHSPIFFQHIMATVSGYQRNKQRYGKIYTEHRAFLRDFDTWPLAEKLEYQRKALVSFINHAYQHSAFYRELYQDIDITSIRNVDDLKLLPIVDKEMLRENMDRILALPEKGLVEGHTGGTMGKSLVVRNSVEDNMKHMAMLDHFKSRVGFEHLTMRRATFNGKHIVPPGQKKKVFWRYNAACKQMIYSSFFITEDNMGYYIDSLNKFKPQAIDGFFSCMLDIAGYIRRHQIKLSFTPIAIFPTSETLTKPGRELLESVFGCKVYNQYSSSEGAPFVTECYQQQLHIELSSGVFERMNERSDEVLVTSFTTHGTPLIRYQIGDEMKFSQRNCDCGIESTMVEEIQGRRLDFLYTAEGAKINSGNAANLFKNMPNALIRAQLIQKKMDELTILMEVDPNLYKEEYDELLRQEFLHKFGPDTRLIIEHVDEIPKERSGKFRMIKNYVDQSE